MALVKRLTFTGDIGHLYFDDGSILTMLPGTTNQWIAGGFTGDITPAPTGTRADIVAWLAAHESAFAYSQASGRLNPVSSGYTDCSGLTYYVYKVVAGLDIGTWTGAQQGSGTIIQEGSAGAVPVESGLLAADLVFFNWSGPNSNFDDVKTYVGSNQLESHGGPGVGPTIKSLSAVCAGAYNWRVRRYIP